MSFSCQSTSLFRINHFYTFTILTSSSTPPNKFTEMSEKQTGGSTWSNSIINLLSWRFFTVMSINYDGEAFSVCTDLFKFSGIFYWMTWINYSLPKWGHLNFSFVTNIFVFVIEQNIVGFSSSRLVFGRSGGRYDLG